MKIIFSCGNKYGRGTYVRAMHLARHLSNIGHDITVTYNGQNNFSPQFGKEYGFKTIGLPSFLNRLNLDYGASPFAVQWLKSYINKERFDLIHGFEHFPVVHSVCSYAQHEFGTPYISDWADFFSTAEGRLLFRVPFYRSFLKNKELQVRRQADAVTVISRPMQKFLLQNESCNSDNILYLPGGAPVDQIFSLDRQKCRQQVGIPEDGFCVGYMGTSLYEELLPYLKTLSRLQVDKKIWLVILGAEPEKIKNILNMAGFDNNRAIFPGFVPEKDVGHWLGALDVCLLPLLDKEYNYFRWPNKIGYYMAAARPIIASVIGEVPSVFAKGDIGWLVDNSEVQISKALLEASESPTICNSKGSTARYIAEKYYTWQLLAKQLSDFYSNILHKMGKSYAKT